MSEFYVNILNEKIQHTKLVYGTNDYQWNQYCVCEISESSSFLPVHFKRKLQKFSSKWIRKFQWTSWSSVWHSLHTQQISETSAKQPAQHMTSHLSRCINTLTIPLHSPAHFCILIHYRAHLSRCINTLTIAQHSPAHFCILIHYRAHLGRCINTPICIVRTMPWQDVCLSVCHTPVLCVNGYTYPQNFFTVR